MSMGRGKKTGGKGVKGSKPRRSSAGISAAEVLKRRQLNHRRKNQAQRAAGRAQRPLPRPGRPPMAPSPVIRTAPQAGEALVQRLQVVQAAYTRLDREANLEDVYQQLGRIEELFTQLPARLDGLRARGYVHSGQLEDRLEQLDEEWDNIIRPNVERQLRENIFRLDRQMTAIEKSVGQMTSPNELVIDKAESTLRTAEQAIGAARANVTSLFQGTLTGLGDVQKKIHDVEWMMEHIELSPEIDLLPAEGPLLAVEAEWEEDGQDEGPDGLLYLTDQRLLFEQKEEVATKKFLFITTDSEVVQKLLLEVMVRDIQEVAHEEEGRGFLSMRKDDILELVLSASAPVSRARFHIRGHEAADWAIMIKRVQSGAVDDDRVDAFVQEIQEAAELTTNLPEKCPSCYAAVPPQPRGVVSLVCDFCGSTIRANRPAADA